MQQQSPCSLRKYQPQHFPRTAGTIEKSFPGSFFRYPRGGGVGTNAAWFIPDDFQAQQRSVLNTFIISRLFCPSNFESIFDFKVSA